MLGEPYDNKDCLRVKTKIVCKIMKFLNKNKLCIKTH